MTNSKPTLLRQIIAFFVAAWSLVAWKAVDLQMGGSLLATIVIGSFGIYGIWVAIGLFRGREAASGSFYKWAILYLIAFAAVEFSIEPVLWKATLGCLMAAASLAVLGYGLRCSSSTSS
jgi:hypothetical protein